LFECLFKLSTDLQRSADDFAKIINGAKPADLPIERADKFEFVGQPKDRESDRRRAANGILLRADEVIE
jgi:hypothetical protein